VLPKKINKKERKDHSILYGRVGAGKGSERELEKTCKEKKTMEERSGPWTCFSDQVS
jgi:hypothetical protein